MERLKRIQEAGIVKSEYPDDELRRRCAARLPGEDRTVRAGGHQLRQEDPGARPFHERVQGRLRFAGEGRQGARHPEPFDTRRHGGSGVVHRRAGRSRRGEEGESDPTRWKRWRGTVFLRPVKIRSSTNKPQDAFIAIPYRDFWFWIDDRDQESKSLFTFLMFLILLTETGDRGGAPVISISAGG